MTAKEHWRQQVNKWEKKAGVDISDVVLHDDPSCDYRMTIESLHEGTVESNGRRRATRAVTTVIKKMLETGVDFSVPLSKQGW